uniref:Uncharacterized protein n=1 Tax=Solanum tuberosum TaxID=4113 RepID=M1DFV8_SOLTU
MIGFNLRFIKISKVFERREKKRRKEEKKQGINKFLKNYLWISSRGDPYEILTYFGDIVESKCLGKEPIESRRFRVENRARKFGDFLVRGLGRRASQSSPTCVLKFGLWGPRQPVRPKPVSEFSRLAPGSPDLLPFPTYFRLSSLATYLSFIDYFYTLRYVLIS